MYQFKTRPKWLEYVQRHIMDLEEGKPTRCLHQDPHYPQSFESPLELQFHLQDFHGIEYIKNAAKKKRARDEVDDVSSRGRKRLCYNRDDGDEAVIAKEYTFTYVTIGDFDTMSQGSNKLQECSDYLTPSSNLTTEHTDGED